MAINSPENKKSTTPGKAGLLSPLYSSGSQPSLGAQPVGGPTGGLRTPDPLGLKDQRGKSAPGRKK